MEYTNDKLIKMDKDRHVYNRQYARYFIQRSNELKQYCIDNPDCCYKEKIETKRFFNRSDAIKNCLNLWDWDAYHADKLLDLKRVNRCKNTRFCPNCKKLEMYKYLHKIKEPYKDLIDAGYSIYFLTLTIPSIKTLEPDKLIDHTNRLFKTFNHFYELYSTPLDSKKSYKERLIHFSGAIRVLEITHNYVAGFHPHLHCIVAIKTQIADDLLSPKYKAKYSRKRKSIDYKNEIEMQISKVWSLCWIDKFSVYNMQHYDYNPREAMSVINDFAFQNLECNFKVADERSLVELVKYTVKDSEISSYKVFICLYYCLYRRRVRQGYGVFYNIKIDNCIDDEGELQSMPDITCEPEDLIIQNMRDLYTIYADYKKISRYMPDDINIKIDD